ncbi:MAG: hypothetical protein JO325_07295, partial [Solirubrobacterales bacterium]|nr:hypothetical protein [Solirubrobacterales bacterium]
AATMKPAWTALVGASCQACNAASTAFDGSSIEGVGTPGGTMFSPARDTGTANWLSPVGDGIHYPSVSTADGVVWTVDGDGDLDAFNAVNGAPLVCRPLSIDAGTPVTNITSPGVSIAEHEVFAAGGGLSYESSPWKGEMSRSPPTGDWGQMGARCEGFPSAHVREPLAVSAGA